MRREVFGDELAGEAGGAIDNDVELRRRLHIRFLGGCGKVRMRYFLTLEKPMPARTSL
jgi:hypothetical protein